MAKKRKEDDEEPQTPEQDDGSEEDDKEPTPSDNGESDREIDDVLEDLSLLVESNHFTPAPAPAEEPGEDELPVWEEEDKEPLEEDIDEINYCPDCQRALLNGHCMYCSEEFQEIEDYEIYEKEDEEDLYYQWREEMRKRGELNVVGIFSVVVTSIYVIYLSYPEVLLGLSGDFIFEHFVFYTILLLLGIGALLGAFVMARHVIIYGRLFDTTFEKEIYSRLEPAFAEVGSIKGDLAEMYERMDRMNLYMKRMENRVLSSTNGGSAPREGGGSNRYTFLMILTLAVFLYVIRAPGEYAIYVFTALFLVWWVGITSDYRLWRVNFAWTWPFFAIIVVPIVSYLTLPVFGISLVVGLLGIALTLFALGYYSWAKYYVEGTAPEFFNSINGKH